jgi:outer membrane protein assembly factor BamB
MKKYTTFCVVGLLIFSLFGCSRPKPVENQVLEAKKETQVETPIVENKQDEPIKYPVVIDKSITNTDSEYYHYKIEVRGIADSPAKAWNPTWSYSSKNGGSVGALNILINNQDSLLIRDPKADFDDYQTVIPPDTFFDDFIALNPTNKEILWKYRINKISGYQTLIQGDFLFIGTSQGPLGYDESFFVFCLNKNTGEVIWKCPINGITETNIIFSNNKLFFGVSSYNGNFIDCVDATSGKILYQRLGPENVDFKYNTKFILIDGLLYFSTPDSPSIFSFDITSQEFSLIWKPKNVETVEYMSELTYADPYLLFERTKDSSSTFHAIDLKENKIVWTIDFESNSFVNYLLEPFYDGKYIYFSSYRFLACIDPSTRKLIWSFSEKTNDIQELILEGDKIFIGIEEEPELARSTEQFYRRYLLSIDKKTGKILWKMQKGVHLDCIYKDKLLVSEHKNLYMIDQK